MPISATTWRITRRWIHGSGRWRISTRVVAEAHRRGIRIVLDMVMNHTSDRHPWFEESRAGRDSPRRDWYLWRDRPNNWMASFGGSAWERDPRSGQYFLHLFTREQPDLNWRNPAVRRAQLDVFRFWLERGVDGFRLDVFNAYFKHADLPDDPRTLGLRGFDRLRHVYDIDQPEMLPLLRELRGLLDSYPERYAVGETYVSTPRKAASYCGDDLLHAAFSFDFTDGALVYPWSAEWIRERIDRREAVFGPDGPWPCTVMGNHDLPRTASRYCRGEDDTQARIAMTVLLTLRGTPFLYYGEEIGMRDIRLARRDILDPPGKRYWPLYKGRDGCRAPMQWDATENAGFSGAKPWLPAHPDCASRNAASQAADPDSLLALTRALIALRKRTPALVRGSCTTLSTPRGILAYLRSVPGQSVLVVLSFRGSSASLPLPPQVSADARVLFSTRGSRADAHGVELGAGGILLLGTERSGVDDPR